MRLSALATLASLAKTDEPIAMLFGTANLRGVNTTERPVRSGDATLNQITSTACFNGVFISLTAYTVGLM